MLNQCHLSLAAGGLVSHAGVMLLCLSEFELTRGNSCYVKLLFLLDSILLYFSIS